MTSRTYGTNQSSRRKKGIYQIFSLSKMFYRKLLYEPVCPLLTHFDIFQYSFFTENVIIRLYIFFLSLWFIRNFERPEINRKSVLHPLKDSLQFT